MIDLARQLKIAAKTGKVVFGCTEALEAARSGRGKLIVLSSNCPDSARSAILHNARLSNLPVYIYSGSSMDLRAICEKPFPVAAVTIREPGDSEILKVVEKRDVVG
jgi:large subunit ribosomal protein L30e